MLSGALLISMRFASPRKCILQLERSRPLYFDMPSCSLSLSLSVSLYLHTYVYTCIYIYICMYVICMLSVFKLTCIIFEQTEGRMMGGEGAHIVETRMFCTVCLKSSCLLICFHSWSLDLSQTLIQTLQILKEDKTGPKPWQNPKKKFHPMSPVQLLLRPSPWVETFCFFFFVFSKFLPPWPKNAPKPMEKPQKKKFHPMSPVQLLLRPTHGSIFLVFSRFLPLCQSNNVSRSFFCVFFVFLFLGSLGEIFTLTSIHWPAFTPPHFILVPSLS